MSKIYRNTMTANEEKAQEMSEGALGYIPCNSTLPFYLTALKMAKYKDSLIREELEKAIEKANLYYDEKLNPWRLQEFIGQIIVLSRLLGEEFPKDRLHMGFATLD